MNFLKAIDRFLDKEYASSPLDLSIYRMLLCVVLISDIPMAKWLYDVPDFMFSPPLSLAAWLTEFPSNAVFTGIHCIMAVSVAFLFLGVIPKTSSVVLLLTVFGMRTFAYSTGKINHDILILVVLSLLSFSHWSHYSWTKPQREEINSSTVRDGFPLAMLAFVIVFWMATAGWQKITTGWLNPEYSVVYKHVFYNLHISGRDSGFVLWSLNAFPGWLWEIGDWMTVIFEFSGLALVWRRHLLAYWFASACLFHLAVHIFLAIDFALAIATYAAFVPWSRLGIAFIVKPTFLRIIGTLAGLVMVSLASFSVVATILVWLAPIVLIGLVLRRNGISRPASFSQS